MEANGLLYEEVVLGVEGVHYIVECLKEGRTLAQYLLSRELGFGSVQTLLPPGVDQDTLTSFRVGGKFPTPPQSTWRSLEGGGYAVPIPNANACLAKIIKSFLADSNQNICIFENALAGANDPYLTTLTSTICTYKDEVYHLLTSKDATATNCRIETTIEEATSIPIFIGALTSWQREPLELLPPRIQLTEDSLSQLALQAKHIVIGAYDGESYLIWTEQTPGAPGRVAARI